MSNATSCRGLLPDGTYGPEKEDIYMAYYAACKMTWGTEMKTYEVKVFYVEDGEIAGEVPSYLYCDDCNYQQHTCPGCGEYMPHNSPGACQPCMQELAQCWEVAGIDPDVGSKIRCKLSTDHAGSCEPEA